MKCQFWARASFPQDKGNRSWSRARPPPICLGRPGGGGGTQGSPGLRPGLAASAPAALFLCRSHHTRGKGVAEASFSALFLEIINLCPSPSSLFLPHFFPPG